MKRRTKLRYYLEDHLPFRLRWLAKLVVVEPKYWLKILRLLDYRTMLTRDPKTANTNNAIVNGMILKLRGPEMLEAVLDAARTLEMRVFLTYGTLLGHVRDGGFIAHDWDIDVGILESDIPKIPMLADLVGLKGFPVVRQSRHRMAFRDRFNLIHLDIDYYFFDGAKYFHHIFNVGKNDLYTFSYSRAVLDSLTEVRFLGRIRALVPGDADGFLTETYGDWRTPRRDQQPTDFPNATIVKLDPEQATEYLPFSLAG